MSLTPGLVHLKLIAYGSTINFLFSGSYWEELISRGLPLLEKFELCCVCRFNYDDAIVDKFKSLIDSFRKPFWMTEHCWFVTCDYVPTKEQIRLYTTPVCMTNFDKDSTRYEVSSIDNAYRMMISPQEKGLAVTEVKVYAL